MRLRVQAGPRAHMLDACRLPSLRVANQVSSIPFYCNFHYSLLNSCIVLVVLGIENRCYKNTYVRAPPVLRAVGNRPYCQKQ
jgi:hypothetical protein